MWDLIVSVPDHFLSFYFPYMYNETLLQHKENSTIMVYGKSASVNYIHDTKT